MLDETNNFIVILKGPGLNSLVLLVRLFLEIDHFFQHFLDHLHIRWFWDDLIHLVPPSFLDEALFSVASTRDYFWLSDVVVFVESAD